MSTTAVAIDLDGLEPLRAGWVLLRRFFWRAMLYCALAEVAVAVVVAPLLTWSLYLLVERSGAPVRMNHDLVDLLLHPRLLLAVLWLVVTLPLRWAPGLRGSIERLLVRIGEFDPVLEVSIFIAQHRIIDRQEFGDRGRSVQDEPRFQCFDSST